MTGWICIGKVMWSAPTLSALLSWDSWEGRAWQGRGLFAYWLAIVIVSYTLQLSQPTVLDYLSPCKHGGAVLFWDPPMGVFFWGSCRKAFKVHSCLQMWFWLLLFDPTSLFLLPSFLSMASSFYMNNNKVAQAHLPWIYMPADPVEMTYLWHDKGWDCRFSPCCSHFVKPPFTDSYLL